MSLSQSKLSRIPGWRHLSWPKDKRPLFLATRSSTWFISATVGVAIFTDTFLYAVIVPVFPFSLADRNGVAPDQVQHWLSILLATYASGLLVGAPIFGYLADRVKYRRGPLLLGLLAIAGSTLMLCLVKSLALLVVARLLQGLSASIIWVVGLALMADTVRGDELAVAMGYVSIAYSLGTLLGPLLGGVVYAHSGYFAVFGMTFGVILLDIIMRLVMVEQKQAKRWIDTDHAPANVDTELYDTKAPPPAQIAVAVQPEKKRRLPPIISLWASRRMLASFWGTLVVATLFSGMDTTVTLFVKRTFEWDSQAAGLIFLALLLPTFVSPYVGTFVDKQGGRWWGVGGLLFLVLPLALLRFIEHNTLGQKILLAALLALIGFGAACMLTAVMAEFGKVCDDKVKANPDVFGGRSPHAQAYSLFNISWAAGSLAGAFWAGGVYDATDWKTLTWTWALLCGLSAIPVMLFTDGWIGKRRGSK